MKPTFTTTSAVSILIMFLAVLFGLMLMGLFVGHLVFMCYCQKTTNESLKRGDKHNYNML